MLNLYKWLTAPLWHLPWFLLCFSVRWKASTPGHSLWLVMATCWVSSERLCKREPPPAVRWLDRHGESKKPPHQFLEWEWNTLFFFWRTSSRAVTSHSTAHWPTSEDLKCRGLDYPVSKTKSWRSVKCKLGLRFSSHWRNWRKDQNRGWTGNKKQPSAFRLVTPNSNWHICRLENY